MGVDVGENFLDVAAVRAGALELSRIALAGIEDDPVAMLAGRFAVACPGIGPGWLAAIDSPRWPIDLNAARSEPSPREMPPRSREIDRALLALVRRYRPELRLSLFPTPRLANFAAQAAASSQPHLKAAFARLFPGVSGEAPPRAGLRFTRFMLAGFLAFRSLAALGAQPVEAYPDLQFRVWGRTPLLPKRESRRRALESRQAILAHLLEPLGLRVPAIPASLDQADAMVLATTCLRAAREGSLALLEIEAEGAFLIAAPRGFLSFTDPAFCADPGLPESTDRNRPAATGRYPRR